MIRRRIPALLSAAALAAGSLALTAGAASASTTTSHDDGFAPQVFIIHQEDNNPGTVKAFGPISGRGTDLTQSDTRDLFVFRKGSVNVDHEATFDSRPKVDRRACTATIFEKGRWQLDPPGTGKYTRAKSKDGKYQAVIVLGFRHKHDGKPGDAADGGKCRIDLNKQPETTTADVFAAGKVTLGKHGHDN